ncbi:glutathione S-transferase [Nitrospirillum sp. BR 11164]|uniref:glutathione S-transferase family protein n=1 Tax=Nitrospirillum sp. BR 11164 TaxID=3104324 RepID=UPI002AFE8191|nr:glutathione S-transferase [Nitrospirillum sp. BR 11164]MEA1648731.1 glutathione S-transferase [Nitrospirillum sp. BR 11164]
MRLIGMPDSPYVRRVGISLVAMGLPFEHERVSVFRHYDTFAAINPVVKAPTLVLDDGTVLMDSTLILDALERLVPADRHLMPADTAAFIRAQRLIGLALVACEKTVQVVYELELRPEDKQHQPWLERVRAQAVTAFDLLEREVGDGTTWMGGDRPNQADITTAVAWYFAQNMAPGLIDPAKHPGLVRLSDRAEALPEFQAVPYA